MVAGIICCYQELHTCLHVLYQLQRPVVLPYPTSLPLIFCYMQQMHKLYHKGVYHYSLFV
jgi:hypothetical protein